MTACIDTDVTTERLEAEACTLAAQIAAATYRSLALIAELDRREASKEWGCRSMAHWLSWKCALGMTASRDHVRVARAPENLPKIGAAYEEAQLSSSKVQAISRAATPGREHELLEFAEVATGAQCEQAIVAPERMTRAVAELFLLARERALEEVPFDPENNSAELRRADAFDLIVRSFLAGRADRVSIAPETIATAFGEPMDVDLAVTWLVSTYLPERN